MTFINGQRRDVFADGSFTDTNLSIYRQFSYLGAPRFSTTAELESEISRAFSSGESWTLSGNSYTWLNGQELSAITIYGTAIVTQYGVSSPVPELTPLISFSFGLAGVALTRRRLTNKVRSRQRSAAAI